MSAETWAVVLAGGTGTRLWPASRPERPKQLLPLGEDRRPLVARAVERALRVAGRDRVRLIANRSLMELIREAVPDLEERHLLVEPAARGTGPALTWAAHRVAERDPDAVMLSFHADHLISPPEAFDRTARRTAEAARGGGRLFCIGARPTRPETGYGYVLLGRQLDDQVHEVEEFVEKPTRHWARRYVDSGEYLWNTGLFAWRAGDFLDVVRERAPELSVGLEALGRDDVEGFFGAVEPVSVDVAVMERAPSVGVVEADFSWDDLGVWTAVARTIDADESGNALVGDAEAVEARNNMAWSEDGRIVLFGVEDLVVVRSGGQTLVTSRDRAPDMKRLLEELEARRRRRREEETDEEEAEGEEDADRSGGPSDGARGRGA